MSERHDSIVAKQTYQIAINAMKAGRDSEAINYFVKMTQDYPTFSGPYANLGLLYDSSGRKSEATAAFDKALKLQPLSARIYNSAGLHYRSVGRFDDAEVAYKTAIKISSEYPDPVLNLAILFDLYLNKPDQAIVYYKHYLEINKNDNQEVTVWLKDLERRSNDSIVTE